MQNDTQNRVETIFHASRSREAGTEREAYLDGACGCDTDVRARVDALLEAHDQASDWLEDPAVEGTREGPGTTIGPYKLLQELGEGGMGVVYMAEQEKPVRRKVALKVIKLGMDTRQVIARFEAERQALALMDHPHIARVLDVGATESGRPYFVMELVRGIPINEYCDKHKLPTDERLNLFVEVCRAVQHAHLKGIIHRDLKPTNVLVTSHDGKPVPKIIDFGVAKATNQKLTERTLFTEFQQIIGTPEYMSPEQAEMSGLDVDTRSDVYALGVLLYQLLTGTTPVDPTALRTAGFEEMTRMIREEEPPAPSTRVSKLGADAEKIAKHRSSDAGSLSRHFRGDLDWIVMKALEKDRTRRYETASAFAEDVTRHLDNRPVEASPPGALYRVRKFTHRNRKAVVAALILVAVVGLGLAGTTAGFLRASSEAERASRASGTLQDVLAMTDSALAAETGEEIEDVLATVHEVFGEDHAMVAVILDTLAGQLHEAGDFDAAEPLYRESLEMRKQAYGATHFNVGVTLGRLGRLRRAQGHDEEAADLLRAALAIFADAADAPDLAADDARTELADLLSNRGESAEAEALYRESLAALRASPSPRHLSVIGTLNELAHVQLESDPEKALETLEEIYHEVRAFYPEDSPYLATSAMAYGAQLFRQGRKEEAEPYLREAIERLRAWDKPAGIYLLAAGDPLFQILRGREDPESVLEADDLVRDLIAVARNIWGVEAIVSNQLYYATRMVERERYVEALDTLLDAHRVLVDAGRDVNEREQVRDAMTMFAFNTAARPDLAPEAYDRALEAVELGLVDEPGHPVMLTALGGVYCRQGEFELAVDTLAQLTQPLSNRPGGLARQVAPADHGFRALAHAHLGRDKVARAELEKFRAGLRGSNDKESRAFVAEIEALLEQPPSPAGDG